MSVFIILLRCPAGGSSSPHRDRFRHLPKRFFVSQVRPRDIDHGLRKMLFRSGAHANWCAAACGQRTCRTAHVRKRYAHQPCAGYPPAGVPIHIGFVPDADTVCTIFCSNAFPYVLACPGGPAYVSYRRFASYATAGEGRCPFEPRQDKRQ